MKQITQVHLVYNADQLLPAAEIMIKKLKKYLVMALDKMAPMCAMILDPQIKMAYIEKNSKFIKDKINSSFKSETVLSNLKVEARHFD